jgi:hypothetical protein
MATPAAQLYASGLVEIARGTLETADLRVLLVQPSYRFDLRHAVVDDETGASPRAHELTVEGYGRQALQDRRLVVDGTRGYLDAADLDFGDLEPGERIGAAILYREAGTDRLSPLIAYYDLGREPTRGGPVTLACGRCGGGAGAAAQSRAHPMSWAKPQALRLYWDAVEGWVLDVPVPLTQAQLARIARWAVPRQVARWRSLPHGDRREQLGRAISALERGELRQRLVDHDGDGVLTAFASTTRVHPERSVHHG